jgi:hypothetical protein
LSNIFHVLDVRAQFFVPTIIVVVIIIIPIIAIVRIIVGITRRTNVEIGCLTADLLHETSCASRRARNAIVKIVPVNINVFLFFFDLLMLN